MIRRLIVGLLVVSCMSTTVLAFSTPTTKYDTVVTITTEGGATEPTPPIVGDKPNKEEPNKPVNPKPVEEQPKKEEVATPKEEEVKSDTETPVDNDESRVNTGKSTENKEGDSLEKEEAYLHLDVKGVLNLNKEELATYVEVTQNNRNELFNLLVQKEDEVSKLTARLEKLGSVEKEKDGVVLEKQSGNFMLVFILLLLALVETTYIFYLKLKGKKSK